MRRVLGLLVFAGIAGLGAYMGAKWGKPNMLIGAGIGGAVGAVVASYAEKMF